MRERERPSSDGPVGALSDRGCWLVSVMRNLTMTGRVPCKEAGGLFQWNLLNTWSGVIAYSLGASAVGAIVSVDPIVGVMGSGAVKTAHPRLGSTCPRPPRLAQPDNQVRRNFRRSPIY